MFNGTSGEAWTRLEKVNLEFWKRNLGSTIFIEFKLTSILEIIHEFDGTSE